MTLDLNRKKVTKNAFRITKVRGATAIRVRVPGGHLDAELMKTIAQIAERFGDGTLHITIRQGFEIPNIPFERMPEVNAALAPIIERLELPHGVKIESPSDGYPAAGMRNISACIGARVCPFANTDTTALAQKLEALVYPNDFHTKIAVTGCPNNCAKATENDIGVMGAIVLAWNEAACDDCGACEKICPVSAIRKVDERYVVDTALCLNCSRCTSSCPRGAWTVARRGFVLWIGGTMGRTPRLADRVGGLIESTEELYSLIERAFSYYRRNGRPKERFGRTIDRIGVETVLQEIAGGD